MHLLRAGQSVAPITDQNGFQLVNKEVLFLQDVLAFLLSAEARDLRPLLLQVNECAMYA